MLKAIQSYFFEKEKSKRLNGTSKTFGGFHRDRKNHYGIVIDASNADDRVVVSNFAEELRREGNRVKILGYVNTKMESLSTPFDIFTIADLNKLSQVPKSPVAESFMNQAFDVLINLSFRENHKALEYICAVSKANFRIGPWYSLKESNSYDLCLDAGQSATLKEWIGELMHTLQKIY